MFKIRFISAHLWLLLLLGTVFIKIYQYNLYIKTTYEHQRLGRCFASLEKERNELLVCLYEQQQPLKLMQEAEKQGMQPLALDAIITTTQVASVDFVGTMSTASVLEQCGIPVIVASKPEVKSSLALALRDGSPIARERADKKIKQVTELAMVADRLSTLDTWLTVDVLKLAERTDDNLLNNFIIEKV